MSELKGRGTRAGRSYANGAASRRRILEGAVELFAANGYHSTGIEAICQAVGVGRGSLYHHIGNKEALLFEICHDTIFDLLKQCERVLSEDLTKDECFRALMRASMGHIADHSLEWSVASHDFTALTGQRLTIIQEARDRYELLVLGVLEDAAAAGQFREIDPLVVKGILGYYNYSFAWIRRNGAMSPEQVADTFSDVLLNGLRVPSESLS